MLEHYTLSTGTSTLYSECGCRYTIHCLRVLVHHTPSEGTAGAGAIYTAYGYLYTIHRVRGLRVQVQYTLPTGTCTLYTDGGCWYTIHSLLVLVPYTLSAGAGPLYPDYRCLFYLVITTSADGTTNATFNSKIVSGRSPFSLPSLPFAYLFDTLFPLYCLSQLSLPVPFSCPLLPSVRSIPP